MCEKWHQPSSLLHRLYFVLERLWCQHVVLNKTLVIACITSVFSDTFKNEFRDCRTKDAFSSMYPLTHLVTPRSVSLEVRQRLQCLQKSLHHISIITHLSMIICQLSMTNLIAALAPAAWLATEPITLTLSCCLIWSLSIDKYKYLYGIRNSNNYGSLSLTSDWTD